MSTIPPALAAALSDRYHIDREVGAGGMATVYLAHDVKHDRDVALKVLKESAAAAIGVERFQAEIRTTARLKHPHILPLFDSGSADGTLFYVMPFIEGESLHQRIQRVGPLPIEEAIRILRQVADALGYAHASGVVHCDIKTSNVMVAGGHAYVADFGIARAVAVNDPDATITGAGGAMGTLASMSPEQIVGGAIDQRTDIYSLGALGYEMLTGALPFGGTPQEIASAQLTKPPDPLDRRRSDAPAPLVELLMRCLEKRPESRPAGIDEVLRVLDAESSGGRSPASSRRRSAFGTVAIAAAGGAIVVALAVAWYAAHVRRTAPTFAVGRLTHVTTDAGLELDPAISPDGRTIAYAAGPPGRMRIYVRELAGGRAVPLTEEDSDQSQRWPQWSPDAARIVFFEAAGAARDRRVTPGVADTLYLSTPLAGTARRLPVTVPDRPESCPSWSPDGKEIAFATQSGLYAVSADGANTPRLLASGNNLHSPAWSPDGRRIAYVSGGWLFTFGGEMLGNVETSALMVLTLSTGRAIAVTDGNVLDTNPVWMPDSRTLLFISTRGGGRDIYSVGLAEDGRAEQDPQRVTSGVSAHGISIRKDGQLLLYSSYEPSANIWSVRIPDTGSVSVADAQQITFGNEKIEKLTVSRDGRWIAYDSDASGAANVWKVPVTGGRPEQVTHGPDLKFVNDWSPDGTELTFHSMIGGQRHLFVVSADGTKTETVTTLPGDEQHSGWGPDGNSIVFDLTPPTGERQQAYIVTRVRPGAPWSAPRQVTKSGSYDPKWSPDGRLIAFCAGGLLRVIAPDGTAERVVVDARSGDIPEPQYPIWSSDSQTIYYKAYDRERQSTIWAVPVAGGQPRLMVRFDVPSRRSLRREFASDGQRFYFTIARDESDIWGMQLIPK